MCFLNAILQCLYHTPMLRRNLALACESALVKDQWLLALQQLFAEMNAVDRENKALTTATEMASLIQAASTNGGLAKRSVKCKSCGDQSVQRRSEYCFCVTCPMEKGRISLDELLSGSLQEEHIDEWKCDKCRKPGCVRQAGIEYPPNVLLVHVSRLQRGLGPTVTFEKDVSILCESQKGKKKEEAFSHFHQKQQAEVERLRQSIMSWNHRPCGKEDAKQVEPIDDPFTPPGTELSSTTAGSEGRCREDHAWSPPQEVRRRSLVDFSKWSLFHSCQCSVASAEHSDNPEDDAMHCM
eukprot:Skav215552  [mRNA]  locus=scaffold3091:175632:184571:- [translate_table: standard]